MVDRYLLRVCTIMSFCSSFAHEYKKTNDRKALYVSYSFEHKYNYWERQKIIRINFIFHEKWYKKYIFDKTQIFCSVRFHEIFRPEVFQEFKLTLLPASLLWRFINCLPWSSPPRSTSISRSLMSMKFFANL